MRANNERSLVNTFTVHLEETWQNTGKHATYKFFDKNIANGQWFIVNCGQKAMKLDVPTHVQYTLFICLFTHQLQYIMEQHPAIGNDVSRSVLTG